MIDTHAHLDDEKLDYKKIIKNMSQDKLDRIISVGTGIEDMKKVVDIANSDSKVFACIGFHAYMANEVTEENLKILKENSKSEKVVGIGEFGLDYHIDFPTKEVQKEAFVRQIKVADELNLPICLHIRDAHEDALEILKANKDYLNNSGIIHCYSGGLEYLKDYLKLGFYISLSGAITYKKSYREIAANVPLERLLLETDSPYLAPQAVRGTLNEPKNVRLTAQFVADSKEMSVEELEKITNANCYNIFKKLK